MPIKKIEYRELEEKFDKKGELDAVDIAYEHKVSLKTARDYVMIICAKKNGQLIGTKCIKV